MIIVGLDPGAKGGAATAIDGEGRVLHWATWLAESGRAGFPFAARAAKNASIILSQYNQPIRLVTEAVYIRVFGKKTDDMQKAKQLETKGWIGVDGSSGDASIYLAKCQGIWLCMFPEGYWEVRPTEWRKIIGLQAKGRDGVKAAAIRIAQTMLPDSDIRATIAGGNDHLAESYLIAEAGRRVFARLGG